MKKTIKLNESLLRNIVKNVINEGLMNRRSIADDEEDNDFKEQDTGDHDFDNETNIMDMDAEPDNIEDVNFGGEEDEDDIILPNRMSKDEKMRAALDNDELRKSLPKPLQKQVLVMRTFRDALRRQGITDEDRMWREIERRIGRQEDEENDVVNNHQGNPEWETNLEDERNFLRAGHYMNESKLRNIIRKTINEIMCK